jgi:hypothetical protein
LFNFKCVRSVCCPAFLAVYYGCAVLMHIIVGIFGMEIYHLATLFETGVCQ